MKPGAYLLNEAAGPIEANVGRKTTRLVIKHRGDRPIQVGSHFHFFEVNRDLVFDRSEAYGMRLNVPAGTAVRFEPGETKMVNLVALAGARIVFGHNALIQGELDNPETQNAALEKITELGFGHSQVGGD